MSEPFDYDSSSQATEGMLKPHHSRRDWTEWFCILYLGLRIFGAFGAGLFFLGVALPELARQELSIFTWKETQGTVIDSRTEWVERRSKWVGRRSSISYTVRVRYRYAVDGEEYESERITTGDRPFFMTVHEAQAFREQYPPGKQVRVLYAPYAPWEATLIAERSLKPWIVLGLGTYILLVVGRALHSFLREMNRADQNEPGASADGSNGSS